MGDKFKTYQGNNYLSTYPFIQHDGWPNKLEKLKNKGSKTSIYQSDRMYISNLFFKDFKTLTFHFIQRMTTNRRHIDEFFFLIFLTVNMGKFMF